MKLIHISHKIEEIKIKKIEIYNDKINIQISLIIVSTSGKFCRMGQIKKCSFKYNTYYEKY